MSSGYTEPAGGARNGPGPGRAPGPGPLPAASLRRVTPTDLRAVREQLPCLGGGAYLNSGAIGPLALPAARALARWAEDAPARARGSLEGFGRIAAQSAGGARRRRPRSSAAAPETIALTANTTQGLNLVAWGIDWRPGDEIVTTALEHPGVTVPLAAVARRPGARLRVIDAERSAGDLEAAVGGAGGAPHAAGGAVARLVVHRRGARRGRRRAGGAGGGGAAGGRRRPGRRDDPGRPRGPRAPTLRLPRPQVAARPRGARGAVGRALGAGAHRRDGRGPRERRGRGRARRGRRDGAAPVGAPLRGLDAARRAAAGVGGEHGVAGGARVALDPRPRARGPGRDARGARRGAGRGGADASGGAGRARDVHGARAGPRRGRAHGSPRAASW